MGLRWSELVARSRRRGTVAFVLSGGGPLGAIQVGYLRALLEEGIVPDVVVGSSVGAFNGVFVAGKPSPSGMEELAEIWLRMRRDDLFPGGRLVSALNVLKRGTHVYSSAGLRRLVETLLDAATFEELPVPAHIVATNLHTGEEAWFSSGSLAEPLLASTALPGVFPPVEIEGSLFIDGGVANNVPVSRAADVGARKIYVLNVNSVRQRRALNRPYDFLMHGMVLARAQRYPHDLERVRRQATVIELPVVQVGHVQFTDVSQTERLISAGYEAALALLRARSREAGEPEPEPRRTG